MNETICVAVQTDKGIFGYGECIPREYLTGETIESCLRTLEHDLAPRLADLRFPRDSRPDEILGSLCDLADKKRVLAAYGAVDIAIYDAWARHFRIPMTRMLSTGDKGGPIASPLTAPIGLGMTITGMTHIYRRLGFRRFKIKIQSPEDLTRVAKVRKLVGPKIPILLDANGAFGAGDAAEDLSIFAPFDITVCEEPLAAKRFRDMVQLERDSGIPLMADESLCTRADADALTTAGGIRWWNLRLAKNGGFTGVLSLAQKARTHGVEIQLGALVGETSLLSAAGATILPALNPTFAESSFPQWLLKRDPFTHAIRPGALLKPQDGVIGLGVLPRTDPSTWPSIKLT
jgi:muconate cycloisomerase